ncbi:MAG TPA: nucleotidyltransferase family protein [Vicinamibacterales bacterium]|nr:nucleotidyltransferase family protein [Vicinamibacterales bacterium]
MNAADAFLARILRGDIDTWPTDAPDPTEAVRIAEHQGVAPLLSRAVGKDTDVWPRVFLEGLRTAAHAQTALALARRAELVRVLRCLMDAKVRALVIKGAHLAFTVYESPELRPRLDTDLLIDESDVDRARDGFARLGYRLVPHVTGTLAMPQFHVRREEPSGLCHQFDVHWRLAVPQAFSELPLLPELWERSVPVASLGPGARGPSLPDALLISCAHRAAHHSGGGLLIWIVDVQRIAERLNDAEAAEFAERASQARITSVAGQALALARDLLGANLTDPLTVVADAAPDRGEPSAPYVSRVGAVRGLTIDLRSLGGWRPRIRLLREHLLPPRAYMRGAYAPDSRWPLPALYLRRAVVGAARWAADHVRPRITRNP